MEGMMIALPLTQGKSFHFKRNVSQKTSHFAAGLTCHHA